MLLELARKPVIAAFAFCAFLLFTWTVFTGSRSLPGRKISSLALSASGRWLAAGTAQGKITVWDRTRPDAPRQIAFPHGTLNDLRFSPDERLLAIASADLGIYSSGESASVQMVRSDRANYGSARFSGDGQTLLVVTAASRIETIDAHTGALRREICCSSIYGEAAFAPDGRTIISAGHWPSLWDAASGQLIARLTGNREFLTFRPIAFDVGRDAILMGSQDGRVYSWDVRSGKRLAVSPAQRDYVDTLAVSASGWVVFAGFGTSVQLWNPKTGERRSLVSALPTSNLVLTPDGASIIFGTANGTIETWSLIMEKRVRAMGVPGL